ncbi:MAG: hypothetical protein MO852_13315 [Candidatus Devosia euplotis]|nr:hypothetical protein [Candidatus Devosia euplotis]
MTLKQSDFVHAQYDVLTIHRTLISQRPVRLTPALDSFAFFRPGPAVEVGGRGSTSSPIVAVVRMMQQTTARTLPQLTLNDTPVNPDNWPEIREPGALDALTDPDVDPSREFAFGKFDPLVAVGWSRALFALLADGTTLEPREAVSRLSYYVGRRLTPLAVPLAIAPPPRW